MGACSTGHPSPSDGRNSRPPRRRHGMTTDDDKRTGVVGAGWPADLEHTGQTTNDTQWGGAGFGGGGRPPKRVGRGQPRASDDRTYKNYSTRARARRSADKRLITHGRAMARKRSGSATFPAKGNQDDEEIKMGSFNRPWPYLGMVGSKNPSWPLHAIGSG
jgi:hypothetical protein